MSSQQGTYTDTGKILLLALRAEEPLVITDGSAESMGHQTQEYVPGSMLLGAFATQWRQTHKGIIPDDSEEFCSLFLSNDVSWGHAYPILGSEESLPLPLCWQKKKNHGGLPEADEKPDDCRVVNLLALEEGDNPEELFAEKGLPCEEGKLKKLGTGFMSRESLRLCKPGQMWNMHVAMSTQRKAADRQLFGFSSIAPQTNFLCTICCKTDEIRNRLKKFLETIQVIQVGHARSAGYGKLARTGISLKDRQTDKLPDEGQIVLFLESDYIPSYNWESPIDSLRREIQELAGCDAKVELTPNRQYCDYFELTGFNSMWRLPRRSVTALSKGSVVTLSISSGKPVLLPQALGGRRNEGYGRVLINPNFLKDKIILPDAKNAQNTDAGRKPEQKPSETLSGKTRFPLYTLRYRSLMRQAEEAALAFVTSQDIEIFLKSVQSSDTPTNSQLGNLRQLISSKAPSDCKKTFTAMLEKTPGEQWKQSVAKCPFTYTLDHLSDIMQRFLDFGQMEKHFFTQHPSLVLGKASADEETFFKHKTWQLAMLALLSAWNTGRRNVQGGSSK